MFNVKFVVILNTYAKDLAFCYKMARAIQAPLNRLESKVRLDVKIRQSDNMLIEFLIDTQQLRCQKHLKCVSIVIH